MYSEVNKKNLILSVVLSIIVLIGALFSVFSPALMRVKAENITYSNVLDDLKKDSRFDETLYPAVSNDYSVDLITIAEGNKNDLFLYVYQPSNGTFDLRCTKAALSVGYSISGDNISPVLYDLELLSTSGVFVKYLVKDIVIPNEETHYFNIVALYRSFNSLIDTSIEGGITNDVAFPVGEQWCCYMKDGILTYEMNTFKTVKITPTLNGNVYYDSGFSFNDLLGVEDSCDSHFLAFNLDGIYVDGVLQDIDVRHIYGAELTYKYRKTRDVSGHDSYGNSISQRVYPDGDEIKTNKVKLTDDQSYTYQGKGLFAKEFTWKRIMTSSEFVKNFELQGGEFNEASLETLKNSQYVFCFAETENKESESTFMGYTLTHDYTKISEVSVLTIHFMDTSGTVYNLGVVADITTADDIPDGEAGGINLDPLLEDLKFIFKIFALVIIMALVLPILSPILKFIITLVFDGVRMILYAPFWFLSWLFGKE